jgi:hypothetical protein
MKRLFDALKKTCSGILRVAASISLLLIPLGFILSGSALSKAFDSILHLKVSPGFTGGRELARFYDPAGDDRGAGTLTYPTSARFEAPGSLDIVKYVVYEPVVLGQWSTEDVWQLGVTLAAMPNPDGAPGGFSLPAIRIYVDTDGALSGSTDTARPRSELVRFDPAFPWDLCVEIDGWRERARLVTASGTSMELETIVVPERSSVYVRLPLSLPEVKRVLDGRPTRHYVLTLASDPVLPSGAMPVREEAGQSAGGGAASSLTPRVYDVLAAERGAQESMLSSFDEEAYAYATIAPVVAAAGTAESRGPDLEALAREAEEEDARSRGAEAAAAEAALAAASDDLEKAIALFRLARFDEARPYARSAADAAPKGSARWATATAYAGALAAMEAASAGNPADQVRIVNEAFAALDAAVAAAEALHASDGGEKDALMAALLCRAGVAASVPNEVFGKAVVASADFERAAALSDDPAQAAALWLQAGLALEAAGRSGEVAFLRAASYPEAGARIRFELAKRGLLL